MSKLKGRHDPTIGPDIICSLSVPKENYDIDDKFN
jgi:hypothetical protein